MKNYVMLLGCLLYSGFGLMARAKKESVPVRASKPAKPSKHAKAGRKAIAGLPIEDLTAEFKEEGSLKADNIANKIIPLAANEDNHGKWVIFKFYESKKQNKATMTGDKRFLTGKHKADILKFYTVKLFSLDTKLINEYNKDAHNGPMYVCYEVQPHTDEMGPEYIKWCLDEDGDGYQNDIFFATNYSARFIANNLDLIISGKNLDDYGIEDED